MDVREQLKTAVYNPRVTTPGQRNGWWKNIGSGADLLRTSPVHSLKVVCPREDVDMSSLGQCDFVPVRWGRPDRSLILADGLTRLATIKEKCIEPLEMELATLRAYKESGQWSPVLEAREVYVESHLEKNCWFLVEFFDKGACYATDWDATLNLPFEKKKKPQ